MSAEDEVWVTLALIGLIVNVLLWGPKLWKGRRR